MTISPEYQTMQLFIDKVAELENSRFVKSISQEFHLDIHFEPDKLKIVSVRPDQDNINAFILSFRFFIQKRDGVSIMESQNKSMKKIFDSNFVTDQERGNFYTVSKNIDSFFLESTNMTIYDENISNYTLMDTFIYGSLAHTNKSKAEKFNLWMSREDAREFLWHKFSIIILTVLQGVQCIRDMLKIIIDRNKAYLEASYIQSSV